MARTWHQIITSPWQLDGTTPSRTSGNGRNDIGNRGMTLTITFVDGEVRTLTHPYRYED